ncbi:hypothetical protein F5880DRAFT_982795 [Lentinula raphanica]|nr:hypothetical protein F5880DRAFT_982795 [Lentinula raphanica]
MRSRVVCSLFAAVLYCVVSVTTSPLPTPSPMPPAQRSKKSAAERRVQNNANQRGKIHLGLRTGFGTDDDWLMLTESQEKRKQATPLVCFSSHFCIGYDKDGGVHIIDVKIDGRRYPVAGYYVDLPMTTTPAFGKCWKTYKESMQNVPKLLQDSGTLQSELNPDTFIRIVVKSASRYITSEDLPKISGIINFVHSLKEEVVPGVKSVSTGRTFRIWVGLFRNKEPLSLGAPLEERKEADPAICYGTILCLYYGKDGTVQRTAQSTRWT